jgi:hypothetical protein
VEGSIEAQVRALSTGQIVVGEYALQVNAVHGDLITAAGEPILPRARTRPVSLLPEPFPNLIDRVTELATAWEALRGAVPVELYGAAGAGKTVLARHMAHDPAAAGFVDGVIWLPAQRAVDDLLQSLFDVLFETDIRYKPSDGELRRSLQPIRAAVLVDDLDLAPDQVDLLTAAAPGCSFLLTSVHRHLWNRGRAIELGGFGLDDALLLVERRVGHSLTPEDRLAVEELVGAVQGNPRALLEAAELPSAVAHMPPEQIERLSSQPPRTLAESAALAHANNPIEALDEQMVETLPAEERRALTVLAALPGVKVADEHVAVLADLQDPPSVLHALEGRQLVEIDGYQYRAVESAGAVVRRDPAISAMRQQALTYFISVAESRQRTPRRLVQDHEAMVYLVQYALDTQRWAEGLRLVRAVEGSIALAGYWALWGRVLGWGLDAARHVEDQSGEAWALHQLGTRALCIGEAATASTMLTEALRIREAREDQIGAEVTRHNLGLLAAPPSARRPAMSTGTRVAIAAVAVVLALLVGAVAAAAAGWHPFGASPTATPTASPTATVTMTATVTTTSTVTTTATTIPAVAPTATSLPAPSPTLAPSPAPTSTSVPTAVPSPTIPPAATTTPTP